jgi:tRNA pseudouridine(38-40) synthase
VSAWLCLPPKSVTDKLPALQPPPCAPTGWLTTARATGFQRQPHDETVEDALFGALWDLDVAFEDGSPVGYTAAGRTDAGVSARAQTVAFEAPEWLRPRAFDAELPTDVRA